MGSNSLKSPCAGALTKNKMKTSTQLKNGKRSVSLEVKPQPAVKEPKDHLSGGYHEKDAERDHAMEGVEPIFCYNTFGGGEYHGIGWRKSDGKWFDFKLEKNSDTGALEIAADEITLPETLEWVEHMEFAELRMCGNLMASGNAYINWIQALRAAVKQ